MNPEETETIVVTEIEEAQVEDLELTDFVVVVSQDGAVVKRVSLAVLEQFLGAV